MLLREMAVMFGVSRQTIGNALSGKSFKDITPEDIKFKESEK
jgi:DNA-binding XRE family transcriptional regulator